MAFLHHWFPEWMPSSTISNNTDSFFNRETFTSPETDNVFEVEIVTDVLTYKVLTSDGSILFEDSKPYSNHTLSSFILDIRQNLANVTGIQMDGSLTQVLFRSYVLSENNKRGLWNAFCRESLDAIASNCFQEIQNLLQEEDVDLDKVVNYEVYSSYDWGHNPSSRRECACQPSLGSALLCVAAKYGFYDIFQLILQDSRIDVHTPIGIYSSPPALVYACAFVWAAKTENPYQIVQDLLVLCPEPLPNLLMDIFRVMKIRFNARPPHPMFFNLLEYLVTNFSEIQASPICEGVMADAIFMGHLDVVKFLLSLPSARNLGRPTFDVQNWLYYPSMHGHSEVVLLLLDFFKINLDARVVVWRFRCHMSLDDPESEVSTYEERVEEMTSDELFHNGGAPRVMTIGEYLATGAADGARPHFKEFIDVLRSRAETTIIGEAPNRYPNIEIVEVCNENNTE